MSNLDNSKWALSVVLISGPINESEHSSKEESAMAKTMMAKD
jgi:hypothetical protein